MSVEVDSKPVEAALRTFPDVVRIELRKQLRGVGERGLYRARGDVQAKTVRRSGETLATLEQKVSVGKSKAKVRILFAQPGDFYAAWVNYGLAPRPWHERATTRSGKFISSRIGKAKVRKPWGITGRHFAKLTQSSVVPDFGSAVEAAIAASSEVYRTYRS